MRAQCKLWVYLGPLPVIIATIKRRPGKNKHYPEGKGVARIPAKGGRSMPRHIPPLSGLQVAGVPDKKPGLSWGCGGEEWQLGRLSWWGRWRHLPFAF